MAMFLSGCATQSNIPEPPDIISEQTHKMIQTHKEILGQEDPLERHRIESEKDSNKCNKADWIREAVFLSLLIIVWGQTLDIVERTDEGYTEANPILGSEPSKSTVNTLIGAMAIGHPIVACKILPPKARKWFQWISIGIEGWAVQHNYNNGIRINF